VSGRRRFVPALLRKVVSAISARDLRRAPNILVAGLAKTGTTILFSRIEASLPTTPRTFFEPRTASQLEAILSSNDDVPTLTKMLVGHVTADDGQVARFSHVVLTVRDPRDQIISELLYEFFKFQQAGDSAGFDQARSLLERKVDLPGSMSVRDLYSEIYSAVGGPEPEKSPFRRLRDKYTSLARFRAAFEPLVVRYEDIVDDRLRGLATYLLLPEIRAAEVDESVRRVARSKGYGEWRQWLTPEDLAELDLEFGPLLREFGYLPEPASTHQSIPRATSLGYVDQFRPLTRRRDSPDAASDEEAAHPGERS